LDLRSDLRRVSQMRALIDPYILARAGPPGALKRPSRSPQ
jgi:hypothetical protein